MAQGGCGRIRPVSQLWAMAFAGLLAIIPGYRLADNRPVNERQQWPPSRPARQGLTSKE